MKSLLSFFLCTFLSYTSFGQDVTYEILENIPYYGKAEIFSRPYIGERCVMDIYLPKGMDTFPTVVWFHGGGLTGGEKFIPETLKEKKMAIVAVNYRLSPKVEAVKAIEDAAAATAWVFHNIENYGGNKDLIFVSGHSAGGYLTSMIGLDKSYLQKHDIDADDIAGLIPFSGHTITHLTVRKEQGIPDKQPTVDNLSPLFHVRKNTPPMLLITGDRELEMLGRYEENAYFWRMMKVNGNDHVKLLELDGFDHGGMAYPAFPLLLKEVQRISSLKKE